MAEEEAEPAAAGPDPDGWETVSHKKKKKGGKKWVGGADELRAPCELEGLCYRIL